MLKITYNSGFYASDQISEAWLTNLKTNRCKLIKLVHPGYQYLEAINEVLHKRGFEVEFR